MPFSADGMFFPADADTVRFVAPAAWAAPRPSGVESKKGCCLNRYASYKAHSFISQINDKLLFVPLRFPWLYHITNRNQNHLKFSANTRRQNRSPTCRPQMPLCTLQHTGASFLYGYLSDQHASYAFCFSFRSALSAYMRSSAMRNSASGSGAGSAGSAWKPILAAT